MTDNPLQEFEHIPGNRIVTCNECGRRYMAADESRKCQNCALYVLGNLLAVEFNLELAAYNPDIVLRESNGKDRAVIAPSIAIILLKQKNNASLHEINEQLSREREHYRQRYVQLVELILADILDDAVMRARLHEPLMNLVKTLK